MSREKSALHTAVKSHAKAKCQSSTPAQNYDRARDLPKLALLWPQEIADTSYIGRLRLLAKLRRALRNERQRGLAGHWTYDLARHNQLLKAYRAETSAMIAECRVEEALKARDAAAAGEERHSQ